MKKRFSTIISSLHGGGSCKSKDEISSSAMPPIFHLSPINPKTLDTDFPLPTSARWMAAPAVVESTAGCGCLKPAVAESNGRKPRRRLAPALDTVEDDMSRARETPAYLWRREEKWHVVACSGEVRRMKIDEDEDSDEEEVSYTPPPLITHFTENSSRRKGDIIHRRRRSRDHKTYRSRSKISSFSSSTEDEEKDERDDEDEDDVRDEEDGDETSTLLSPPSFATSASSSSTEPRTALASSAMGMLKRLVPCAAEEGKVRESFAVVKKSEDPTGDFWRSMAEMVVEKGIYDAEDLEQLLHCFLSLNSRHHHFAIVSAFTDIWQTLFPRDSAHFSYW